MIKKTILKTFLVFLFFHFFLAATHAQEEDKTERKFGLGLTLFNLNDYSYTYAYIPFNAIYATIHTGKNFVVEPGIGVVYFSKQRHDFLLDLGLFYKNRKDRVNMLYGLRAGSYTTGSGSYILAPTVGCEVFIVPQFSLAAEFQLRACYKLFNYDWMFSTGTSTMLRIYF